ncbi:cytochrome P450 family protein, partial [Rhizoctonia solani AG-3 Rhs1AP]
MADRERLPYVNSLISEVMRWRPALPTALPHVCLEDDKYRGYDILKGTIVFGNVWSMSRDETVYPSPETFDPERFADSQLPQVPVFGWGRRRCPGASFGEASVFVAIASLLATFTFSHTEGRNVDTKLENTTNALFLSIVPWRDNLTGDWEEAGQLARWASELAYESWGIPIFKPYNLVSLAESWGTLHDTEKHHTLSYRSSWFTLSLKSSWITFYNLLRRATTTGNKYMLCACLASVAFGKTVPTDLIPVFVAFATNPKFRSLEPPSHGLFDFKDKLVNTDCMILPRYEHIDVGASEYPGGMKTFCSPNGIFDRNLQGENPQDFWSNVEMSTAPGVNGARRVQLTGCIRPELSSQLNPGDGGGQYDSSGGEGGLGNPQGSVCLGYNHYVELVEPAGRRACIRCCDDPADCPLTMDTLGCQTVIPGNYFDCTS